MSSCCGGEATKIIYSCSGAADVGELSDKVTRALRKEGYAQGSCIAALGAGMSGYIQSAKGADVNITIDGCPVACTRKILENIGVAPVSYIITDMGFTKGSTAVTVEAITTICNNIRKGKSNSAKEHSSSGCGCSCGGKC